MNSSAVFVENQHHADEIQCEIHQSPSAKKAKMAHFKLGYSSSGLMKSSVILRYWKIIIFELWFLNAWYEIWRFIIFGLFEDFLGFELMIFRSDDEVETV
jgi:hypothetical protein